MPGHATAAGSNVGGLLEGCRSGLPGIFHRIMVVRTPARESRPMSVIGYHVIPVPETVINLTTRVVSRVLVGGGMVGWDACALGGLCLF